MNPAAPHQAPGAVMSQHPQHPQQRPWYMPRDTPPPASYAPPQHYPHPQQRGDFRAYYAQKNAQPRNIVGWLALASAAVGWAVAGILFGALAIILGILGRNHALRHHQNTTWSTVAIVAGFIEIVIVVSRLVGTV